MITLKYTNNILISQRKKQFVKYMGKIMITIF